MTPVQQLIVDLEACGCVTCKQRAAIIFTLDHNATRYYALREHQAGLSGAQGVQRWYDHFDQQADRLVQRYLEEKEH